MLVEIRGDAVQVLAANRAAVDEPFPLGHRQPIIPPFGAVFLVNAAPEEIEQWLARAPDGGRDRRDLYLAQLAKVRESGYSLLAAEPQLLQRQQEALSAFELSDRLPWHGRAVRQATSDLAELFFPDLEPGERYDLASIVVPVQVPADVDLPRMAIRMTGLPASATTEQIEAWAERLKLLAAAAGAALE